MELLLRSVCASIEANQILMFDSVHARTCLHHAAYFGHVDCLQAILSAAQTTTVADSWGFAWFVNVRDDHGATSLHLAARQGQPGCLQVLLENGAIVSALTGSYGFPGSTSLHLAARSGNLDCIRKLLAWGADCLQRDSAGRIPYAVALKRNHQASAALLNPSSAEPMVWPSPLKFISELDLEAKALLEAALMEPTGRGLNQFGSEGYFWQFCCEKERKWQNDEVVTYRVALNKLPRYRWQKSEATRTEWQKG